MSRAVYTSVMNTNETEQLSELSVILHNIRSAHNVGAIFRTADALGVSQIYLSGYTPLPVDRFDRPRKDIAKAALGAELSVHWEYAVSLDRLIDRLKHESVDLVAIEQDPHAVDYKEVKIKGRTAFLVGSEVEGLSEDVLERCDVIAEIPMHGTKESLNVSVAFGVALFRMLNI